jgi:hypothetical protein
MATHGDPANAGEGNRALAAALEGGEQLVPLVPREAQAAVPTVLNGRASAASPRPLSLGLRCSWIIS